MEALVRFADEFGRSPWLDNLTHHDLVSARLAELRDHGMRGLTSNPTIFQRAIQGSDNYEAQLRGLTSAGGPVIDYYWKLVLTDIVDACDVFRPTFDGSDGRDGFVSVELDPAWLIAYPNATSTDRPRNRPARPPRHQHLRTVRDLPTPRPNCSSATSATTI